MLHEEEMKLVLAFFLAFLIGALLTAALNAAPWDAEQQMEYMQ